MRGKGKPSTARNLGQAASRAFVKSDFVPGTKAATFSEGQLGAVSKRI
jgi:hypothetical protein